MIKIQRLETSDTELMKQVLDIRQQVFVVEQGVDAALEYDGRDQEATYYLLTADGNGVGTGRCRERDGWIKIERMAILPAYRNHGLGSSLLKFILNDIRESGKGIYLHSQAAAVSLYARHGFVSVGDAFEEAGIKHYKMVFCP